MINVDLALYSLGKLTVAVTLDIFETLEANLFVALCDIDELLPQLGTDNRGSIERRRVLEHRAFLLGEEGRRVGDIINYIYFCGRRENDQGVY